MSISTHNCLLRGPKMSSITIDFYFTFLSLTTPHIYNEAIEKRETGLRMVACRNNRCLNLSN